MWQLLRKHEHSEYVAAFESTWHAPGLYLVQRIYIQDAVVSEPASEG